MRLCINCWLIIGMTLGFVLRSTDTSAQLFEKGIPESFLLKQKQAVIIPTLRLDSIHVQKMIASDRQFRIDNRYGVVQQTEINIKTAGVKTEIEGGGTIWRYQVESNDAFSLGIFFKTYRLPPKAKVFIYDSSGTQLRGAFTAINNNPFNQLPVAEFSGKNLIIEYDEPASCEFSGELVLGSVSQAYIPFQSGVIDRIGINCPQGDNWKMQKNSVCLMTFHDLRFSYFCTGALINNVREDLTPYFLTANHCIQTEEEANTLVTYFNYENSTCSSFDASDSHSLAGATFKSGSSYSDFTLLLLNEYPPDEYNPYFAGWDARGNNPDWGVCIHHPNGQPKCIAIDSVQITSDPEKVQWSSDGLRLSSTSLPNTHWGFHVVQGAPEYGSSGSPLFDQNKRVVGQLHGGDNFMLLYGKFSLSWNFNSSYTEQLAHWLDPDSTTLVLDGIWKIPPTAGFRSELQEVCPNTPVLFYDESTQRPSGWVWHVKPSTYHFAGGTDSTSQNPQIVFLDEGNYTVTLKSSNKYGSNRLTQENYIHARTKLQVRFLRAKNDNLVCGCDLKKYPLVAAGGISYDFKTDRPEMIATTLRADTAFLTLNPDGNYTQSFDTWVKVTGTNGTCTASDSMMLHVLIQTNDNIVNAARLHLGRNTGYSNKCATVEMNEPHPSSTCTDENSWCPNPSGRYSVLNNSVWFTFIAPADGLLTIDTRGFDDQIAVYKASSYRSLLLGDNSDYRLVAANDNRSATDNTALLKNLVLEPGKLYWLQVDGDIRAFGDLVIDLISNSLEVFPNPSKDIFNVIISNPGPGNASVAMYDLNGRKILTRQYTVSLNSNKFILDLSGYPKGIYLLNVQVNGSILSKKLILN